MKLCLLCSPRYDLTSKMVVTVTGIWELTAAKLGRGLNEAIMCERLPAGVEVAGVSFLPLTKQKDGSDPPAQGPGREGGAATAVRPPLAGLTFDITVSSHRPSTPRPPRNSCSARSTSLNRTILVSRALVVRNVVADTYWPQIWSDVRTCTHATIGRSRFAKIKNGKNY
jgi:hypothetical protein